MAIAANSNKNLWIAASDGDLERVRYLIESEAMSPNAPDANTYTPMHAAASYAHLDLLAYLMSKGGDINVTDEDGDTPLFTVESEETARWMVEHGARVDVRNGEGLTAAEHLFEDHPEAAVYLQSVLNASTGRPSLPSLSDAAPSSTSDSPADAAAPGANLQVDSLSSALTADMLARTEAIMRAAERDGTDPDAALQAMVGEAVRQGQGRVYGGGEGSGGERAHRGEADGQQGHDRDEASSKRSRAE